MDFAERAARNEEAFRAVNERIEEGAELHGVEAPARFHCECDRVACFETVQILPQVYREVIAARYVFVTLPGHADDRVERVVEERDGYCIVEKIGEARKELDRRHPQERHRQ